MQPYPFGELPWPKVKYAAIAKQRSPSRTRSPLRRLLRSAPTPAGQPRLTPKRSKAARPACRHVRQASPLHSPSPLSSPAPPAAIGHDRHSLLFLPCRTQSGPVSARAQARLGLPLTIRSHSCNGWVVLDDRQARNPRSAASRRPSRQGGGHAWVWKMLEY